MSKIVTKGLSKVFGPQPKRAFDLLRQGKSKNELQEEYGITIGVHEASVDIKAGEVFVLMGLSGSGKSTLLRLLNRLHEPTTGEILIDGTDITKLSKKDLMHFRRKKFSGMVFQQFAILPHRTVIGNVEYGLEIQGVPQEKRRQRAMEVIEQVGLKGWADSYSSQLSGGMQQRVGLARALAVDADILLMDEAFSALDPLIRREMQEELLELQANMNKTIVFVTHDLDEALKLGDRIAIMKDGQVVQVGTAEEIIAAPANDYVSAFVEDVNPTGVLTASSIMQPPRETAHLRDGPRTVLNKIRRHGISGIFVTDSERVLKGYIDAKALAEFVEQKNVKEDAKINSLIREVTSVDMKTPLTDVINLPSEEGVWPVAVVDERQRLQGVLVKGSILAVFAKRGRAFGDPPEEQTESEVNSDVPAEQVA